MEETKIIFGEAKMMGFEIKEIVLPINCCWELTEYETGRVEANGVCSVEAIEHGYTLYALILPQHKGLYRLIYSFGVGQELRRPCMIINVK